MIVDALIIVAALAVCLAVGAAEQRRVRRNERQWAQLRERTEYLRALERAGRVHDDMR